MDEQTTQTKPITRHADKLLVKARTHLVRVDDIARGRYVVVSGGLVKAGGNEYTVNVFATDGEASCNCDWATKRPATLMENKGATACSHTIAVFEFIAQGEGRKVSAFNNEEQAVRQHRPLTNINDGIILTARRLHRRYVQASFLYLVDRKVG